MKNHAKIKNSKIGSERDSDSEDEEPVISTKVNILTPSVTSEKISKTTGDTSDDEEPLISASAKNADIRDLTNQFSKLRLDEKSDNNKESLEQKVLDLEKKLAEEKKSSEMTISKLELENKNLKTENKELKEQNSKLVTGLMSLNSLVNKIEGNQQEKFYGSNKEVKNIISAIQEFTKDLKIENSKEDKSKNLYLSSDNLTSRTPKYLEATKSSFAKSKLAQGSGSTSKIRPTLGIRSSMQEKRGAKLNSNRGFAF